MNFASLDYRMLACRNHLDATNSWATEIEMFLVQYLLIRICAEWENRIPLIFERRCTRGSDPQLTQFAVKTVQYVTKRFAIKDLGDVLKRFDTSYHVQFTTAVTSNNAHIAWDSIYVNRNAVAHGAGVQMNLSDLTKAYQDCLSVLDALTAVLDLTPEETKDFV